MTLGSGDVLRVAWTLTCRHVRPRQEAAEQMTHKKRKPAPGVTALEGGRFQIRVTWTTLEGVRKSTQRTLPPGATLGQAVDQRAKMLEEMRQPVELGRVTQRTTVAVYTERWLERKARRVRPVTIRRYIQILADHFLPQFGHLACEDVRRHMVADWLYALEQQDITTATAQKRWKVVKSVLGRMCADLDLRDVTIHQESPVTSEGSGKPRCQRALTAQEVRQLMPCLRAISPRLHLEALVLVCTGLRVGELYQLKWSHVDLDRLVARVVEGKTPAARRVVPLTPGLAEQLTAHRRHLVEVQHPGLASGLVFPSRWGTVKERAPIWRAIKAAAVDAGLDWEPHTHTLRRTYNTMMLRAGVDKIALRSVMGHTDESMTDHYADLGADDVRPLLSVVWSAAQGVQPGAQSVQHDESRSRRQGGADG